MAGQGLELTTPGLKSYYKFDLLPTALTCLGEYNDDPCPKLMTNGMKFDSTLSNEPQHDKINKVACAPSEDSDQPGQPPSLIRVFAIRMKKALVLSYPMSAQRSLWSNWACPGWSESLLGAHSFCWFCHVVVQILNAGRNCCLVIVIRHKFIVPSSQLQYYSSFFLQGIFELEDDKTNKIMYAQRILRSD